MKLFSTPYRHIKKFVASSENPNDQTISLVGRMFSFHQVHSPLKSTLGSGKVEATLSRVCYKCLYTRFWQRSLL